MREQIAQRRHQHQCINERVHAIERPAAPGGPESSDLISGKRRRLRGLYLRVDVDGGHAARTISNAPPGQRKIIVKRATKTCANCLAVDLNEKIDGPGRSYHDDEGLPPGLREPLRKEC